jgi:hypothetical protein
MGNLDILRDFNFDGYSSRRPVPATRERVPTEMLDNQHAADAAPDEQLAADIAPVPSRSKMPNLSALGYAIGY